MSGRVPSTAIQIEVSQIIVHKADQPDVVAHFLDADGLAGEDGAEINLLVAQTDATAVGNYDNIVVEGVIDSRNPR